MHQNDEDVSVTIRMDMSTRMWMTRMIIMMVATLVTMKEMASSRNTVKSRFRFFVEIAAMRMFILFSVEH